MDATPISGFDPDCEPVHDGIYGLPASPEDARLVLIPVPWEVTASFRGGTSRGPHAIHQASRQVEVFDCETGSPYEFGIAMIDAPPGLAQLRDRAENARSSRCPAAVDAAIAAMHDLVQREVRKWLSGGKLIGIVGGEHGVSLGAIKELAAIHERLGVLQIDAHADLRGSYQGYRFSHASFASNVLVEIPGVERIVQAGVRDLSPCEALRIRGDSRLTTFFDHEYANDTIPRIVDSLPENVWVSFDIDGLDPSLCPNTGTPVPGGFSWKEILRLLRAVARCGTRIVGFDLCEVAPSGHVQPGTGWDEIVGARLLYKLIGWTIHSNIAR